MRSASAKPLRLKGTVFRLPFASGSPGCLDDFMRGNPGCESQFLWDPSSAQEFLTAYLAISATRVRRLAFQIGGPECQIKIRQACSTGLCREKIRRINGINGNALALTCSSHSAP